MSMPVQSVSFQKFLFLSFVNCIIFSFWSLARSLDGSIIVEGDKTNILFEWKTFFFKYILKSRHFYLTFFFISFIIIITRLMKKNTNL